MFLCEREQEAKFVGRLDDSFYSVKVCQWHEFLRRLNNSRPQVELGRRAIEVMRRLEMQRQQPVTPNSRDLQVTSLCYTPLQT